MPKKTWEETQFTVRDLRKGGFLWIGNDIFDHFAKSIQASSFMVYLALARRADNDAQCCHPSQSTLAAMLGVGERTVRTALQELKKVGLIDWELRSTELGQHYNEYFLIQPANIAGRQNSVVQPAKNCSPTGSVLPENYTLEQDSIKTNSSPSEKKGKQKQVDTRTEGFRKTIVEIHELKTQSRPYWNAAMGRQLKLFLSKYPQLAEPGLRKWLEAYWSSEINPADPPESYIPRLVKFSGGPLDRFNKPLGGVHVRQLDRAQQRFVDNAATVARDLGRIHGKTHPPECVSDVEDVSGRGTSVVVGRSFALPPGSH